MKNHWGTPKHMLLKYVSLECQINVCAKHLPNIARYPQQHLEVPQTAMAVIAMDTKVCLPITSKGSRWASTAICLHASLCSEFP